MRSHVTTLVVCLVSVSLIFCFASAQEADDTAAKTSDLSYTEAVEFLTQKADAHRSSIKSAEAEFTIKQTRQDNSDVEPVIWVEAKVTMVYDAPRYHLIVQYQTAKHLELYGMSDRGVRLQHIVFDGRELTSVEFAADGQISCVVEKWRVPRFTRVGLPVDDPLYLDFALRKEIKRELKQMRITPLASGGFWARQASLPRGVEWYRQNTSYFVGPHGPMRKCVESSFSDDEFPTSRRDEALVTWAKADEIPYIRRMTTCVAESAIDAGVLATTCERTEIAYSNMAINRPVQAEQLNLSSLGIPVGTKLQLREGGRLVLRTFDGMRLIDVEE